MINKTIYRYEREPGKITVSTDIPENAEYQELHRLIADKGMILVKDGNETFCVDTDDIEGWVEIECQEEEMPDEWLNINE